MHIVYINLGESRKEARERYCSKAGSFIGDSDITLFVIYVDELAKSKSEDKGD